MLFKIVIARGKVVVKILSIWGLGLVTGVSFLYSFGEVKNVLNAGQEATLYFENRNVSFKAVNVAEAKTEALQEVPERDLADYIWMKESTRGKNNYSKCEAVGKVNGIGYGIPGNGSYICFDSHEDEMTALNGWLVAKKAAGWSELKMLCTYSGNNYSECKE